MFFQDENTMLGWMIPKARWIAWTIAGVMLCAGCQANRQPPEEAPLSPAEEPDPHHHPPARNLRY